jgi:hypothetical protein
VLTPDNNIAFYCKEFNQVCTFGLTAGKMVQKKDIKNDYNLSGTLSRMVINDTGKLYFMGFADGYVFAVSSVDLKPT